MDISVGDRATRSPTLTAEHVTGFAELSGDRNPLRFDEDFGAATTLGITVRCQEGEAVLEGEAVCYTFGGPQ